MRKFNANEKALYNQLKAKKKARRLEDAKVSYQQLKNVILAAVTTATGKVYMGYAKYNPKDLKEYNLEFDESYGQRIAFSRAIHK